MKNPYDVLGVASNANESEIKNAYRKLAKENHPDLFQDEQEQKRATRRFKEISAAYDILSDDDAREFYDNNGTTQDKAYDLNAEMTDYISFVFNAIVDGALSQKRRLSTVPFVEVMKRKASTDLNDAMNSKINFVEQVEQLTKMLDRIVRKTEDNEGNVFRDSLEERIGILEEKIEKLTAALRIIKRAEEELDMYDNIVDMFATRVNIYGNATSSTSGSTMGSIWNIMS